MSEAITHDRIEHVTTRLRSQGLNESAVDFVLESLAPIPLLPDTEAASDVLDRLLDHLAAYVTGSRLDRLASLDVDLLLVVPRLGDDRIREQYLAVLDSTRGKASTEEAVELRRRALLEAATRDVFAIGPAETRLGELEHPVPALALLTPEAVAEVAARLTGEPDEERATSPARPRAVVERLRRIDVLGALDEHLLDAELDLRAEDLPLEEHRSQQMVLTTAAYAAHAVRWSPTSTLSLPIEIDDPPAVEHRNPDDYPVTERSVATALAILWPDLFESVPRTPGPDRRRPLTEITLGAVTLDLWRHGGVLELFADAGRDVVAELTRELLDG